jgi:hypothetical protein
VGFEFLSENMVTFSSVYGLFFIWCISIVIEVNTYLVELCFWKAIFLGVDEIMKG